MSPEHTGRIKLKKKLLDDYYCPVCGEISLARDLNRTIEQSINALNSDIERVINQVVKQNNLVDMKTINDTAQTLMIGVRESVNADNVPEYDLNGELSAKYKTYQALEQHIYRFSAAKSYQEMKSMSGALVKDGKPVSFADFKEQASKIAGTYRGDWLRTEYEQALITANRSKDYLNQTQLKDSFPTWQYKTRADGHVREAHRVLHDMKLAANDPVWSRIYPPNGWRCRCYVKPLPDYAPGLDRGEEAIRKLKGSIDKNGISELDKMIKQGYDSNHAAQGTVFPNNHPYWNGVPGEALIKAELMASSSFTRIHTSENGSGFVDMHKSHEKGERRKNIAIAKVLADHYGEKVILMGVDNTPKVHNLDSVILSRDNQKWEFKTPDSDVLKSQVFNAIKQSKRQEAKNVLIKLSGDNAHDIVRGMHEAFGKERFGTIEKLQLMIGIRVINISLKTLKQGKWEEVEQYLSKLIKTPGKS